jgi:hypothetical protein
MQHGPLSCRICFGDNADAIERDGFRLVNDPGWWGASNPIVLVLGQSKGNTQKRALRTGEFDKVGFAGVRDRLARVLASVGVTVDTENPDRHFVASESDIAFASLLRCSISTLSGKTSGSPIIPAMEQRSTDAWIRTCMKRWLEQPNSRLKLVVLLGLTPKYAKLVLERLKDLHPQTFIQRNDVVAEAAGVTWVFAQHPSRISENHYQNWIGSEPHRKRDVVRRYANNVL